MRWAGGESNYPRDFRGGNYPRDAREGFTPEMLGGNYPPYPPFATRLSIELLTCLSCLLDYQPVLSYNVCWITNLSCLFMSVGLPTSPFLSCLLDDQLVLAYHV